MKMEKNKYTLHNIFLGLKKAWDLPKLPVVLLKYYNSLIIKTLRFLGGICFLLLISKISTQFPLNIKWCVDILGLVHILHMLIFTIIKIGYVFYIVKYKPELLNVYNSPLNKASSGVAKLALCAWYGVCVPISATGVATGTAIGVDTILENSGREPVFRPIFLGLFDYIHKNTGMLPPKTPVMTTPKSAQDIQTAAAIISQAADTLPEESQNAVLTAITAYEALSPQQKTSYLEAIAKDMVSQANEISSDKK